MTEFKDFSSLTAVTTLPSTYKLAAYGAKGGLVGIPEASLKADILGDINMEYIMDGIFIMFHRTSQSVNGANDNYPIARRVSDWPKSQNAGEVADGVLVVEGGKMLVVAPTEPEAGSLYFGSENISGGGVTTSDRVTAQNDWAGKSNTAAQITKSAFSSEDYAPGFCAAYSRTNANGKGLTAGKWWLPSLGELWLIDKNFKRINYALSLIDGATPLQQAGYWSSTETSAQYAWYLDFSSQNQGNNTKSTSKRRVRPVSAFIA
jgi:hypothetical protein